MQLSQQINSCVVAATAPSQLNSTEYQEAISIPKVNINNCQIEITQSYAVIQINQQLRSGSDCTLADNLNRVSRGNIYTNTRISM